MVSEIATPSRTTAAEHMVALEIAHFFVFRPTKIEDLKGGTCWLATKRTRRRALIRIFHTAQQRHVASHHHGKQRRGSVACAVVALLLLHGEDHYHND